MADSPISHFGREDRPKPGELFLLQALRGVAVLAVFGYHAWTDWRKLGFAGGGFFGMLWGQGYLGVDCFFCLSGFIIAWVHGDDLGRPERAPRYAWRRFARIYPPYCLALCLTIVVLASAGILRADGALPPRLVHSFFLLPVRGVGDMIMTVAWTLPYEVFFYVLFCGAILFGARAARIGAFVWAAVIVGYGLAAFRNDKFPVADFFCDARHLEFLAGAGAAFLARQARFLPPVSLLLTVPVFFLVLATVLGWVDGPHGLAREGAYALVFSSIILGLARWELSRPVRVPSWLLWTGSASYSIYLTHGLLLFLGTIIARWIGMRGPGVAWAVLPFALAGGFLYYGAIERPLHRFFRKRGPDYRIS